MLNRTLDFFIDGTELPKFIILSDNKSDITLPYKLQFEIDELKARDAARLLLLCANQYIEEANKNLDVLSTHQIFDLISRNPSSIVRFSQFLKSCPNTLDEIVVEQKAQIQQLNRAGSHEEDVEAQVGEECSWVIKQSYEHLIKTHSEDIMILYILCQVPNGLFESDFEALFNESNPKWKDFINFLMNHKERMLLDCEGKEKEVPLDQADQETSWLITCRYVEEASEIRYHAYQIVYSYINKSILSAEEKQQACKSVIVHLSHVGRKIMRSMKKTDIRILSLSKFTAAIDVGLWSDNDDFLNPSLYYKDYENLLEEPKTYFNYHEPNIQQFLDLEYLMQIFPVKSK